MALNYRMEVLDKTASEAIKTIQDLLPNEHILNFYEKTPPKVPDWLGTSLKLILGAGDFNQGGIPNIEKFKMFDVFFCLPGDIDGSLRENIETLLSNYSKQKVICFIDNRIKTHIDIFCELFKDRFELVDGFGGHTPHLDIKCIQKILKVGGTAVNLYETSGKIISEDEFDTLFHRNTSYGPVPRNTLSLSEKDVDILLDKPIILYTNPQMLEQETPGQEYARIEKLQNYANMLEHHVGNKLRMNSSIQFDWTSVPLTMHPSERIKHLMFLLAGLLMYDPLPAGLKGLFKENVRIWAPDRTFHELVVTKVQEGGRRKTKRSKRTKKTRKVRK